MLGHLSYCDQEILTFITQTLKQGFPTPIPPNTTIDELNRRHAAKRKRWSWERIRSEFANTRGALIARALDLKDSQLALFVPSPWPNDAGKFFSLEGLIRDGVLDHASEHRAELNAWLEPK